MWVRAGYSHAREGHTLLSCGHHWPSWQVPLLGGIAGARTCKVISTSRQENCHEITGQQGKRKLIAVALAASAVPILTKPKSVFIHVGGRIVRQDEKHLER